MKIKTINAFAVLRIWIRAAHRETFYHKTHWSAPDFDHLDKDRRKFVKMGYRVKIVPEIAHV